MIRKLLFFLFIIITINTCNQNSSQNIENNIRPYDSITTLIKNYDIENANKYWQKLDSNIDKNNFDTIRWVHEQLFIQILLNANYYDSAKTKILKAIILIDSNQFSDIYHNISRLLSVSELQLGNYKESISLNFKILPFYEKQKNYKRVCGLKANISWAYFNLMEWQKSKEYINETISLAKENKYSELMPDYYQRLATIFAGQIQYDTINKIEKFDSAIFYYNLSLALLDTNEASWDLSNLYLNKGSLYTLMHMNDESIIEFQKALKINKSIDDNQGIANCYSNLGLTYINTNQLVKAEKVLLDAEQIALQMNDVSLLTDINKNLAVLYKRINKYKESSEYYEKYITIHFQELEKSNIEKSLVLSSKYEKEKVEKEIQSYKIEQLSNENKVLILSLIIVFLLGMAFIVFYILNQRAKHNKLIDQIQIENEKKILEQITKETERNRISRNLHDNLGAYTASILNKIKMIELDLNSEYKESELRELRLTAQQILLNLKNIVIDLNQKSLPFLEFIDQVKTELLRLLNSYPEIEFNINENLEFNNTYSPENQFNLKSTMFEMTNNVLKHSQANIINLDISETDTFVNIELSDNGKYSNKIKNNEGNGIKNIKTRLKILKGTLFIKKNNEGGTQIRIQLNKSNIL